MSSEIKQHNIYRCVLKVDGDKVKSEGGIKIPRTLIEREGIGLQYIDYFLGAKSIWVDENIGRETAEVYLDETDGVSPLQLTVPVNNIVLNEFLQKHPMNGSVFELYSEEEQAKKSIDSYNQVKEAFRLIDETDQIRVKSTALAVYGVTAYGKSYEVCMEMLTKDAATKPHVIINAFAKAEYKPYFLAANAYYSGIVKDNEYSTAVIFADEMHAEIAPIPVGKSGVETLGSFLASNTESAKATIQMIGQKVQQKASAKTAKPNDIKVNEPEVVTPVSETQSAWIERVNSMSLEEAKEAYVLEFKKDIAPAFSKNESWIKGKLLELQK